jgi:RimJ/RimL family protein N-acetyltransferase
MDLQLTKWSDEDINDLTLIANNKNVAKSLRDRFPHHYTIEDAKWWISHQKNFVPSQNFAIKLNEKLVGGIGCDLQQVVNRKNIEIGYWLGEPY